MKQAPAVPCDPLLMQCSPISHWKSAQEKGTELPSCQRFLHQLRSHGVHLLWAVQHDARHPADPLQLHCHGRCTQRPSAPFSALQRPSHRCLWSVVFLAPLGSGALLVLLLLTAASEGTWRALFVRSAVNPFCPLGLFHGLGDELWRISAMAHTWCCQCPCPFSCLVPLGTKSPALQGKVGQVPRAVRWVRLWWRQVEFLCTDWLAAQPLDKRTTKSPEQSSGPLQLLVSHAQPATPRPGIQKCWPLQRLPFTRLRPRVQVSQETHPIRSPIASRDGLQNCISFRSTVQPLTEAGHAQARGSCLADYP